MAKYSKRKTAKRKTSRRRRVGAVALNANSPLVKYGSIAAGFIMANMINAPLDKVIPTNIDSKLVAAGQLGLGAALAFKKKQTALTTIAGGVLMGAGLKRAMGAFGIGSIGSYQNVPVVGRVGSYQNMPVIAGYQTAPVAMAGYQTAPVAMAGSSSVMG